MTTKGEIMNVESLDALAELLTDEWYAQTDGSYDVPTWGAKTSEVERRIGRSCPEGDIVSWDTRDEAHPRYLMREWRPAEQPTQRFLIEE